MDGLEGNAFKIHIYGANESGFSLKINDINSYDYYYVKQTNPSESNYVAADNCFRVISGDVNCIEIDIFKGNAIIYCLAR